MLYLVKLSVRTSLLSKLWVENHYKYLCRSFFNFSYHRVSFFLFFLKKLLTMRFQRSMNKFFTYLCATKNLYWKSIIWYFLYQFMLGRRRWFLFDSKRKDECVLGYFLRSTKHINRVSSSVRGWWWKRYLPKRGSKGRSRRNFRRRGTPAIQFRSSIFHYKRKWQLWVKKWFSSFYRAQRVTHWRSQQILRSSFINLFLIGKQAAWLNKSLKIFLKKKSNFKSKKIGYRSFSSASRILSYLSFRRRRLKKKKIRRLIPWKRWYWQYMYSGKADRFNLCYEQLSTIDRYIERYGQFLNSTRYLYYVLYKYVGHITNLYLNIIYITRRIRVQRTDKALNTYGFDWFTQRWRYKLYKRRKRGGRSQMGGSLRKQVRKRDSFWRRRLGIIQLDSEFICTFLSKYLSLKSSSRTMMVIVWRVVGWLRKLIKFEKIHYYVILGGQSYIFKLRRVRFYIHGRFSKRARRKHKMLVDIGRYYKLGLRSKQSYLYYSSLNVPLKKANCAIHVWFFYERKLVAK